MQVGALAFARLAASFRPSPIPWPLAMPTNDATVIDAIDRAKLKRLAAALATAARPGDLLLLSGDLAAGKTQLTTDLAAAIGATDPVASPTFTLAHFYGGGRIPILHIDAYRIESEMEFNDLALDEFFETHLTVVEWPENAGNALPPGLRIRLDVAADGRRRASCVAKTPDWAPRLQEIFEQLEPVG